MPGPPVGERDIELPKDYDDHAQIVALAEDFLRRSQQARYWYEWQQYRNVLFYLGIQWITFDGSLRTLIPTPLARGVPRPVTNKFATVLRPIVSQLAAEEPNIFFTPMTNREKDIRAAETASRALDIAYRETGLRPLRPVMARWLTLTGNTFLISGYDTSDTQGKTFIQNFFCPACRKDFQPKDMQEGRCPMCNEVDAAQLLKSVGHNGEPLGTYYARGRLYTDLAPVFEMYFDWQSQRILDSTIIIRRRMVSRAYLLRQFGKKAEGPLGSHSLLSTAPPNFMEALAYATAHSDAQPWLVGLTDYDRIEFAEMWIDHPQYPQGFTAAIANGKVLQSGPSGYHTLDSLPENMRPLRPITHMVYESVPGRVWGKSPADDLAPKQATRNRLEASIELHMRRCANTVWVAPEGSHTGGISGEVGVVLKYPPIPGVSPPQRQPGAEITSSQWQYIRQIDTEMEDIAGSVDVVRGQAPPRVTAAQALQLLDQRAQLALAEPVVNWSLGHQQWGEQILAIFRDYAVDERFVAAMGHNGRWAVEALTGMDMRAGVRCEVEAGLGRPRTLVAKRAVIEQGVRIGAVNVMDPMERFHVRQILGLDDLVKETNADLQAAERENDKFISLSDRLKVGAQPAEEDWPSVKTALDNHIIHLHSHRRFANAAIFDDLHPVARAMLLAHADATLKALQMLYGEVGGQTGPLGQRALHGQGPSSEGIGGGGVSEPTSPTAPEAIGPREFPGSGVPERGGMPQPW